MFLSFLRLTHSFWRLPLPRRSGRRIRKTRKYDIITTPAERVEMAPLNEENDEDDDSTLFDVKYRHGLSFISLSSKATEPLAARNKLEFGHHVSTQDALFLHCSEISSESNVEGLNRMNATQILFKAQVFFVAFRLSKKDFSLSLPC